MYKITQEVIIEQLSLRDNSVKAEEMAQWLGVLSAFEDMNLFPRY